MKKFIKGKIYKGASDNDLYMVYSRTPKTVTLQSGLIHSIRKQIRVDDGVECCGHPFDEYWTISADNEAVIL